MYTRFLLFSILAISCFTLQAQVPATPMKDVADFRTKLEAMSKKVNTIESDFVQEKNLSVLTNKIISKGHFLYKKDNNIRWEYLQPYKYLIIISNNKIFIKEDQSQKQYDMQSKMFQEMNKFISGCIQGDILKNDQEFKITYYEDDQNYFVTLMPKAESMRKMLNEVHIWFNRSDLTVSKIKMLESGGDYTSIDFINKKLNTDIPVEKFIFK